MSLSCLKLFWIPFTNAQLLVFMVRLWLMEDNFFFSLQDTSFFFYHTFKKFWFYIIFVWFIAHVQGVKPPTVSYFFTFLLLFPTFDWNSYSWAHLGYIPMSLYNHDSWFHHYMGSWFWLWWRMRHLCTLLLARVLIAQTSYFAGISHNAPDWCTWKIFVNIMCTFWHFP